MYELENFWKIAENLRKRFPNPILVKSQASLLKLHLRVCRFAYIFFEEASKFLKKYSVSRRENPFSPKGRHLEKVSQYLFL